MPATDNRRGSDGLADPCLGDKHFTPLQWQTSYKNKPKECVMRCWDSPPRVSCDDELAMRHKEDNDTRTDKGRDNSNLSFEHAGCVDMTRVLKTG